MAWRWLLLAVCLVGGCEDAQVAPRDAGDADSGSRPEGGEDAAPRDAGDGGFGECRRPATGGGPIEVNDICNALADLICYARCRCCSTAVPEETDSCRTDQSAACQSALIEILSDEDNGYDPDIARRELDEGLEYIDGPMECDSGIVVWAFDREAGLLSALTGSIEGSGTDCGGPLNPDTTFLCRDGRACALRANPAVNRTCRERLSEGDCWEDSECRTGLSARDSATPVARGHCETVRGTGELCVRGEGCTSRICEGGSCIAPERDTLYCRLPITSEGD